MRARDFLLTGQWAPSFPAVRPIPDFLALPGVAEDLPECNHIMGQENQLSGGTFSASCTCSHPKTVGVVVLDGSEGQRMPIDFVAQRMPSIPERIFYDFACAALKMALARLPFYALFLTVLVDRFHWAKNHVWCSKVMNPDSYVSVDGRNTSASEVRNAASRRLQNFLRLVNQRNFILFTVYQQAVGNVITMHRDVCTSKMMERWPLWYRKKFVDTADQQAAADPEETRKERALPGGTVDGVGGGGVPTELGEEVSAEKYREARESSWWHTSMDVELRHHLDGL